MKFQNKNEKNQTAFGKWYARAVCDETVDIKGLAAHMASHNTPYSTGAIHGMLKDMVNCTKELLLDGKNVKIDDLAIFSVGLHTTGAPTADDFNANTNITGGYRQPYSHDAETRRENQGTHRVWGKRE